MIVCRRSGQETPHGTARRHQHALKEAMKSGDKLKVSTFRLMNAAIKERDIQSRTAGPRRRRRDAQILEVFVKMVKQRQESLMRL